MDQPRIVDAGERKLVGLSINTSNSENRAGELWRAFKPRVGEILHRVGDEYFSVQIYCSQITYQEFTPHTRYEKWAAVAVSEFGEIPRGMESLTVEAGRYAVFIHRGTPQMFPATAQFIFREWLPASQYDLDTRPQFEIMTPEYRPDDPNATEEVWIPLRVK